MECITSQQKLLEQLTDNSLLRLWKTGGDVSQHNAEDDDCDENMVVILAVQLL